MPGLASGWVKITYISGRIRDKHTVSKVSAAGSF